MRLVAYIFVAALFFANNAHSAVMINITEGDAGGSIVSWSGNGSLGTLPNTDQTFSFNDDPFLGTPPSSTPNRYQFTNAQGSGDLILEIDSEDEFFLFQALRDTDELFLQLGFFNVNTATSYEFSGSIEVPAPIDMSVVGLPYAQLREGTYQAFGPSADAFGDVTLTIGTPVPVPAAVWLFGSALLGLIGFRKKKLINT